MNTQLQHIIAQQHIADLHHSASQARQARELRDGAAQPRPSTRIARFTARLVAARA
jgi:hypothetical protein